MAVFDKWITNYFFAHDKSIKKVLEDMKSAFNEYVLSTNLFYVQDKGEWVGVCFYKVREDKLRKKEKEIKEQDEEETEMSKDKHSKKKFNEKDEEKENIVRDELEEKDEEFELDAPDNEEELDW